jgi:hypothetical protein
MVVSHRYGEHIRRETDVMRHFRSSLFAQLHFHVLVPHHFDWPCVAMYGIRYANLILTRLQTQIMAGRYCMEPEKSIKCEPLNQKALADSTILSSGRKRFGL